MTLQLSRSYTLWFVSSKVQDQSTYLDYLKMIGTFSTVQEFWMYYQHMVRPDKLPEGATFYCFSEGVKPMWEDPANLGGGRFQMSVKLRYANRFWEDILLALIGNQCEHSDYINGIQLQTKDSEHAVIQIWTKDLSKNDQSEESIKTFISNTFRLTDTSKIKYRQFMRENKQQK